MHRIRKLGICCHEEFIDLLSAMFLLKNIVNSALDFNVLQHSTVVTFYLLLLLMTFIYSKYKITKMLSATIVVSR